MDDCLYLCASDSKTREYRAFVEELKTTFSLKGIDELDSSEKVNVIILGGDGTLNYFLNNIANFENMNVLYLPLGTANDFSQSLKLSPVSLNVNIVRDILTRSLTMPIPVMRCNDLRFINVATAGAPALVTQSGSDLIKKYAGKVSYYLNALEEVLSPAEVKIKYLIPDSEVQEVSVFGFAILQGMYAGGGVKLTPHSIPNFKELFEFVAIKSDTLVSAISSVIKMQQDVVGNSLDKDLFIHHRVSELIVESKEEIPVKLDGEEYSSRRLEFKKDEQVLNFYYY